MGRKHRIGHTLHVQTGRLNRLLRPRAGCLAAVLLGVLAVGCGPARPGAGPSADFSDRPIRIVATTSMLADLVEVVGGDRVHVTGLMGPGVDPHLYQASEGDVTRMAGADVIVYNGLHLEGKMTEIFEQMQQRRIHTVAVAEGGVPDSLRIVSPNFAGSYDPHVWFDVRLWMQAAQYVRDVLTDLDSTHTDVYRTNTDRYLEDLTALDAYVREQAEAIPADRRVLITSHDAFGYFGRAYGFQVEALQGLSTATEAGTADVKALAEFVVERRIPAMFIESSVSPRGIEAVREAVRARGFDVRIGGNLYSDSLGDPDGPAGTYIGTVRHNVDTVVEALAADLFPTPAAD